MSEGRSRTPREVALRVGIVILLSVPLVIAAIIIVRFWTQPMFDFD